MADGAAVAGAAARVVRDYLAAMEQRDLARAAALTGPGFSMLFPGGVRFDTLEALVQWSVTRYRRVGKTINTLDVCSAAQAQIVIVAGRLHGEWPDGRPFADIRFIDRFVVREGRIIDQQVWNDLAEAAQASR